MFVFYHGLHKFVIFFFLIIHFHIEPRNSVFAQTHVFVS